MMLKLSVSQIIEFIQKEIPFEAVCEDYSFQIKIQEYTYYICAAIHDGHQFRKSLWQHCLHTDYERWYEEDPSTHDMIRDQPIVIAGRDSRFEYDLNRSPEQAVYVDAWGKKLWKTDLPKEEKELSLTKHANFYTVVEALVKKLEQIHQNCIVYDFHSYNKERWTRPVPIINLGTMNIDQEKYESIIDSWLQSLSEIELPKPIVTTAAINDTFMGNGYFLKFITERFKNTLVLATEFSKIYCDELNYIVFPEVVDAIQKALKHKIPAHAVTFYDHFKNSE